MNPEQRPVSNDGAPVTSIRINLVDRAIELENAHGTIARLDFSGETVVFDAGQLPGAPLPTANPSARQPEQQAAVTLSGSHSSDAVVEPPVHAAAPASPEKKPVVTLS